MTIAQQIEINSRIGALPTQKPVGGFLRDFAEMPAPVMENDHAGSLYEPTPAPSWDEVRRSIREFAILMDDDQPEPPVSFDGFVDDGDTLYI